MQRQETLSRRPVIVILVVAVLTVASIAILSYRADGSGWTADSQLQRARDIDDSTSDLLSNLTDAETGQRGFLLTGREEYLEPYNAALVSLPTTRDRLRRDLAGQPEESELRTLESLTDAKTKELADTLQLRRTQGASAALQEVDTDRGRRTMDAVRARVASIRQEEERRASEYSKVAAAAATRLRIASVGGGFLMLGLLGVSAVIIMRSLDQREQLYGDAAASAELLRVTLTSIGDAVIAADAEMRITFLNPVAENLTGWAAEDALQTPIQQVFKMVNEATRAVVNNPLEKAIAEGTVVGLANHTILIRRDGSEVPIDDSAAPIRDSDAKIRGAVLVFRDISERRRSEKQLHQSNEQLQEFVSGAAHDLRSPLNSVNAISQLLAERIGDRLNSEERELLGHINSGVTRMVNLVDALVSHAQATHFDSTGKASSSLGRALEAALQNLQIEIEQTEASIEANSPLPPVAAAEVHTVQLFQNLIGNALKYHSDRKPVVKVWCDPNGSQLTVHVADNGIGIHPEYADQIFKPFRRLHGQDLPGSGIGLATCQKIVNGYGGRIWVDSEAGKGSTFHFNLPLAAEANAATADSIQ